MLPVQKSICLLGLLVFTCLLNITRSTVIPLVDGTLARNDAYGEAGPLVSVPEDVEERADWLPRSRVRFDEYEPEGFDDLLGRQRNTLKHHEGQHGQKQWKRSFVRLGKRNFVRLGRK
ncbi:unnamed protein product [Calicophoron daubneyi]|uniref:Uncharacterized protein n=1 Tax=Calicophoron daubneyi TaxID=300641 RepID=A0AAV2TRA7_CALDB